MLEVVKLCVKYLLVLSINKFYYIQLGLFFGPRSFYSQFNFKIFYRIFEQGNKGLVMRFLILRFLVYFSFYFTKQILDC